MFTQSVQQVSSELKPLEKFVNSNFNKIFPGVPRNPDFTFWRLMVKIWIYEITNPTQSELLSYSMEIVTLIRKNNFDNIYNEKYKPKSKEELASEQRDAGNFGKKDLFGFDLDFGDNNWGFDLDLCPPVPQASPKSQIELEFEDVRMFIEFLTDISLNEVIFLRLARFNRGQ
jgi:hypothetical protein